MFEIRDKIAFTIYYQDFIRDYDLSHDEENMKQCLKRWKEFWILQLNAEHDGDCNKRSCPCCRCIVERYYKQADDIIKYYGE